MRVLLLIHNLDLGGAQTAVLNLARGLKSLGQPPLVMAWRRTGVLEPQFRAAGIELDLPSGPRGGLRRLGVPGLIRRTVEARGIDVIHAHMSDSAIWAALVQPRCRRPAVVTHHSSALIDTVGRGRPVYGWFRRRLLFLSARHVAVNVAVAEAVRTPLARASGIPSERIDVIPNGIPLPPQDAVDAAREARRQRGERADFAPRLLFLGRLAESKALDILIQAAPRLFEAYPTASIDIVGEGDEEDALQAQVKTLGLTEKIRFRGFAADVAPWLRQADLFVSPSRVEGLPFAVLEAMAWGLPVVASDIPGHRELVRPKETGVLVRLDDPEQLAEALIEALHETTRGQHLTEAAQALVAEGYSEAAMARRHVALYRSLATTPGSQKAPIL